MTQVNYRSEIDGLRAVAVLAVVVYHAGLSCPGGYVGVDVFFVISGYLISSIVLRDLRAGEFSMMAFCERRVRRIFPALAICVLSTLVTGYFLLLPDDLVALGQSAVAQSLFVANVYFWRNTNYFGGQHAEKPLLHTWSLAVEEQFYVIVPVILMVLFLSPRLRSTRALAIGTSACILISFLISVWGVVHQPYATFFLLPTRAWELLGGMLVALVSKKFCLHSRVAREMFSLMGLAGIIVPIAFYSENTPFPGTAALPPCLGTMFFIWANTRDAVTSSGIGTVAARVLSFQCVVFFGLISYSLYLWHWPVIAFANYWKIAPLTFRDRWLLIIASFFLAVISWQWIETPFRRKRVISTALGAFASFSGTVALILTVSIGAILSHGFPHRIPPRAAKILHAIKENEELRAQFHDSTKNTTSPAKMWAESLPQIGANEASDRMDFIILGDSHAGCAIPIFDHLGKKYDRRGTAITFQGTPPLLGWPHREPTAAPDPQALWANALEYIRAHKVQSTFLIAFWSSYQKEFQADEVQQRLHETIRQLHGTGTKVYILHDVPTYDYDPVKSLVRSDMLPMFQGKRKLYDKQEHHARNSATYACAELGQIGAVFLDPSAQLYDSALNSYKIVNTSGKPFYFDSNHLTILGAVEAMQPIVEPVFRSVSTP